MPASSSSVDSGTPVHSELETRPWISPAGTCSGTLANMPAELPAHSTNAMRLTSG
jgi:hypothetical protein